MKIWLWDCMLHVWLGKAKTEGGEGAVRNTGHMVPGETSFGEQTFHRNKKCCNTKWPTKGGQELQVSTPLSLGIILACHHQKSDS